MTVANRRKVEKIANRRKVEKRGVRREEERQHTSIKSLLSHYPFVFAAPC